LAKIFGSFGGDRNEEFLPLTIAASTKEIQENLAVTVKSDFVVRWYLVSPSKVSASSPSLHSSAMHPRRDRGAGLAKTVQALEQQHQSAEESFALAAKALDESFQTRLIDSLFTERPMSLTESQTLHQSVKLLESRHAYLKSTKGDAVELATIERQLGDALQCINRAADAARYYDAADTKLTRVLRDTASDNSIQPSQELSKVMLGMAFLSMKEKAFEEANDMCLRL
jgi:hypothetical protein